MAKAKAAAPQPTSLAVVTKETPILVELLAAAASNSDMAKSFIIDSRDMYEIATATLTDIRDAEKRCEEERKKIADPQHKAWKATNALFKPIGEALAKAKATLGEKVIAYEDRENARVKAAEMAAAQARALDLDAANDALAAATERLANGEGSIEEYQQAAEAAMLAELGPAAVGHVDDPLSRGGHQRRVRWVAEIDNLPDFLEWLAKRIRMNDPTFDNTIDIKFGQLNAFGNSTEGTGKIPGVTFRDEATIAARGS